MTIHLLSDPCLRAAKEYRKLEIAVGRWLIRICRAFCTGCGDCCKAEICAEARESAWLGIVRGSWEKPVAFQFDPSTGWLSSSGCRLKAGRPPLCYEFFCGQALDQFRKQSIHQEILAISKLPSQAGRNALKKRHIVTLEEDEIHNDLDFKRLRKNIAFAWESYGHIANELPEISTDSSYKEVKSW